MSAISGLVLYILLCRLDHGWLDIRSFQGSIPGMECLDECGTQSTERIPQDAVGLAFRSQIDHDLRDFGRHHAHRHRAITIHIPPGIRLDILDPHRLSQDESGFSCEHHQFQPLLDQFLMDSCGRLDASLLMLHDTNGVSCIPNDILCLEYQRGQRWRKSVNADPELLTGLHFGPYFFSDFHQKILFFEVLMKDTSYFDGSPQPIPIFHYFGFSCMNEGKRALVFDGSENAFQLCQREGGFTSEKENILLHGRILGIPPDITKKILPCGRISMRNQLD